jgi:hypothetical protein
VPYRDQRAALRARARSLEDRLEEAELRLTVDAAREALDLVEARRQASDARKHTSVLRDLARAALEKLAGTAGGKAPATTELDEPPSPATTGVVPTDVETDAEQHDPAKDDAELDTAWLDVGADEELDDLFDQLGDLVSSIERDVTPGAGDASPPMRLGDAPARAVVGPTEPPMSGERREELAAEMERLREELREARLLLHQLTDEDARDDATELDESGAGPGWRLLGFLGWLAQWLGLIGRR